VLPELVRKHAVRVNDIWFPVIQAFVTATVIPLSSSRTPLGVTWLRLDSKSAERSTHARERSHSRASESAYGDLTGHLVHDTTVDETWHTEANVQAAVVTALASKGWRICPWPRPPPRSTASMCGAGF
jgi:hypothetical protein